MSKKKFAALPAAGQKALMDASGEAQSRTYGAYWMALDAEGRKDYEGKPDHKIVTLTPAQTQTYRARLQKVVDGWIAATPGSAKVVAQFKTLLAEVK